MSADQFDRLLAELVDGGISDENTAKLAALLRDDPDLADRAARELRLSELIAQELDPARTEDAFMASIRTRFGAERSATRFVNATVDRIRKEDRPKRTSRRVVWWVLPIAACLAVIAGTVAYNLRQSTALPDRIAAHVRATSPGVTLLRDGKTIVAVVGMEIVQGTVIRTGPTQRVELGFPDDDTWVRMDGRTNLQIAPADTGVRLELQRGLIEARVAPRDPGDPFVVRTEHAECSIKGTHFLLQVDRGTRLDVKEGLIAFTRLSDGATVEVAAGQYVGTGGESRKLQVRDITGRFLGPVLPPVALTPDGNALFQDDFETGMENWELLIEDTPGRFRPLAPSESHLITWRERPMTKLPGGAAALHAEKAGGKTLALRLKDSLPAGPIVVEYMFYVYSQARIGVMFGEEQMISEEKNYFGQGNFKVNSGMERYELIPQGKENGYDLYDMRVWYARDLEGKTDILTVRTGILRVKKRQLIITVGNQANLIERVTIRKLEAP